MSKCSSVCEGLLRIPPVMVIPHAYIRKEDIWTFRTLVFFGKMTRHSNDSHLSVESFCQQGHVSKMSFRMRRPDENIVFVRIIITNDVRALLPAHWPIPPKIEQFQILAIPGPLLLQPLFPPATHLHLKHTHRGLPRAGTAPRYFPSPRSRSSCCKMAFHARHRWLISRVCEAYNASTQEVESFLKQGENMKVLHDVMKETTDEGEDPQALFILRQPLETFVEVRAI